MKYGLRIILWFCLSSQENTLARCSCDGVFSFKYFWFLFKKKFIQNLMRKKNHLRLFPLSQTPVTKFSARNWSKESLTRKRLPALSWKQLDWLMIPSVLETLRHDYSIYFGFFLLSNRERELLLHEDVFFFGLNNLKLTHFNDVFLSKL